MSVAEAFIIVVLSGLILAGFGLLVNETLRAWDAWRADE